MEFSEVVSTRRSIRRYLDRNVPAEFVDRVIAAGMSAPSAGNQQPWHFIVITERDTLDTIPTFHPYAKMLAEAPVAVVLCGDPVGTRWPDLWPQDLAACAQTMLLAARDIGLGSVWLGVYPSKDRVDRLRSLLGVPEDVWPFAIISLGWPATEFKAVDRFKPERIHQERW